MDNLVKFDVGDEDRILVNLNKVQQIIVEYNDEEDYDELLISYEGEEEVTTYPLSADQALEAKKVLLAVASH